MGTIAKTMENQQQQMNKITDVPAGISQFLVQGNLKPMRINFSKDYSSLISSSNNKFVL